VVNLSNLLGSPANAIKAATGTSYFSGINDALGKVGTVLESPAHGTAVKMKTAARDLFITDKINQDVLFVHGQQGEEIWSVLQEVQDLSDAFSVCGDTALNAILGAQTDYIKNSGIQQAGRDLARTLGDYEADIDCVAGFATLFEGAGVIDDALGLGDLGQIQRRTRNILVNATDATQLANMTASLPIIQELVGKYNNMCSDMTKSLNGLIQKDLDNMQAALNKLAQWAAFAKLATGDPCALVNNHKMLEHITEPVMEDIIKLYQKATGITATPTNPIIPLGDFLGKVVGGIPSVPKFKQATGVGLKTFGTVSNSIKTGKDLVDVQYSSDEMEYVNGVGWIVPEGAQTNFTKEVLSASSVSVSSGIARFSPSKDNFIANAADKKYEAVNEKKNAVAKIHVVGWCSGGSDQSANRNKAHCEAKKGTWNTKEMTDNEVKVAGSIEAAMGSVAITLGKAFGSITGSPPPSSPSSALVGGPPPVAGKTRDSVKGYVSVSLPGTGVSISTNSPSGASTKADSFDAFTPTPFTPIDSASFVLPAVMPGTANFGQGAAAVNNFDTQLSNVGGDISEYHKSMEVIEKAMKTGDFSAVETCTCEAKAAVASTKEVGACDFSGLAFPDGYKLIEPSFYTTEFLQKVTAAENSGSGEYVMGDDGNVYQSAQVVVVAQYGAKKVDPFLPGKAACTKYQGKWIASVAANTGSSGGSSSYDIKNAKSKAVCENANGSWVCAKGTANSGSGKTAVESYGKFTNKKNVNPKSTLPTKKAFDTNELPSLNFDKFTKT